MNAPLARITGIAAPFPAANVDTDVIIRIERVARFGKGELAPYALETLRFRAGGGENPDFVLNREPYRQAVILERKAVGVGGDPIRKELRRRKRL